MNDKNELLTSSNDDIFSSERTQFTAQTSFQILNQRPNQALFNDVETIFNLLILQNDDDLNFLLEELLLEKSLESIDKTLIHSHKVAITKDNNQAKNLQNKPNFQSNLYRNQAFELVQNIEFEEISKFAKSKALTKIMSNCIDDVLHGKF